jgi:hypothetical protein
LALSKPLVELVVKPLWTLQDLVPLRMAPTPPNPTPDTQFSEELTAFLAQLALEYQALASQALAEQEENGPVGSGTPEELLDAVAASLLYRLNSSGMYHALKERLKPSMMRLHALAATRTTRQEHEALSMQTTFEQKVAKLYADMIDRMHLTLNEVNTRANDNEQRTCIA